jgi:hypothetical protein
MKIQKIYFCTRLTMNGILKDFLKTGDSELTNELTVVDEQK